MAHEFDGKKYEKASAHQKEWGAKLISELSLKGNERVLDLGCGDGVNTALIAEALPNGEVVGIDASKGMIDTAKPKEKVEKAEAIHKDKPKVLNAVEEETKSAAKPKDKPKDLALKKAKEPFKLCARRKRLSTTWF